MDKEKAIIKVLNLAKKLGEIEVTIRVGEHMITGIINPQRAFSPRVFLDFANENLSIVPQDNGRCQIMLRITF